MDASLDTGLEGRSRVAIENVQPEIDAGRFPIKRVVGERVVVTADVFGDGHDAVIAVLRYIEDGTGSEPGPREGNFWREVDMRPLGNDRWRAEFRVDRAGSYCYTIVAWVDRFLTWLHDLRKRVAAAQVGRVDLLIGAALIEAAMERAPDEDGVRLAEYVGELRGGSPQEAAQRICGAEELDALMRRYSAREFAAAYGRELRVAVERERARFSAWYEMFPRSAADEPGRHGTLRDVERRLPYVAAMGFDVLYLPPIHPIGRSFRKGKNGLTTAAADDVGSPWAVGAEAGGHKALLPELGTLDDFRHLVQAADKLGIELALDIAFQCSPDHPYVAEHPQWFRRRPDGTVQYAENPPKKYQDIYPFDFESADWQSLWDELKSVFDFWVDQGVRIFRVDNPHTKPFAFWEWCIREVKRRQPEVLFLAEAFTRPKVMYRLAKLGFTQSYTYFAWRNTKAELTEYLTQLTRSEVREFFQPNFWPNTPDILTEYLQAGGRAGFLVRLVLAATLSSCYGIYGPPFEHGWSAPREPGSEEYLDSEKYQVHHHDLQRPDSLSHFVARINRLRREHRILQTNDNLQFHGTDHDQLICYSKASDDGSEIMLVIVNLDPHHKHSGFVRLPLDKWELDLSRPYQVHDLLSDARYLWQGARNYVELNPEIVPAHIFQIRRRVRTEHDFEYYL